MPKGMSLARYLWLALRILAGWRPIPVMPEARLVELRVKAAWHRGSAALRVEEILRAERSTEKLCLWLNPGFQVESVSGPGEARLKVSWDPEFHSMRLRLVELRSHIDEGDEVELALKYSGHAQPLVNDELGYGRYGHIYKQEVLWYPVPSCSSLIPSLVTLYPRLAEIEVSLDEGLEAASSLRLHPGIPGKYVGARRGWAEPPSIIVAPMTTSMPGEKHRVFLHRGLARHPPLEDIKEQAGRVEHYFSETWGLEYPYEVADIVVVPRGGGWSSGSMHVLDVRGLRGPGDLALQLIHEFARAWWGMMLVPGDSGSYWLLEAVPDYAVLHGLGALGFTDRAKRYVEEARREARRLLGSSRYRPPTLIPLPVTSKEHRVVRIIGALFLYELGERCGHENVAGILGGEAAMSGQHSHVFTWSSMRSKLAEKCAEASELMEKYGV